MVEQTWPDRENASVRDPLASRPCPPFRRLTPATPVSRRLLSSSSWRRPRARCALWPAWRRAPGSQAGAWSRYPNAKANSSCCPRGAGVFLPPHAQRTRNFPGTDLSPSPKFELTAQACGAYAKRVEQPEELPGALQQALKVVKEEKRKLC